MDEEKLAKDRTIDPEQLDVECVRQADVFFQWAEQAIVAKEVLERLELELETVDAMLQLDVRADPKKYNLETTTEAAIKAAVRTTRKYQELSERVIKQKRRCALLDKAVAAMDQKKKMLELLTTLHGQQYFAGPSVPRNLVDAWQQHQKRNVGVNRQGDAARKRVQRREV